MTGRRGGVGNWRPPGGSLSPRRAGRAIGRVQLGVPGTKSLCVRLLSSPGRWSTGPRGAGRSHRARWLTLAVLCANLAVIGLDNTILNVATA